MAKFALAGDEADGPGAFAGRNVVVTGLGDSGEMREAARRQVRSALRRKRVRLFV